jgi:hypothetical protein
MTLKLVVDEIDTVPEAFRDEYTERDGKFHLNVDGLEKFSSENAALRSELDHAHSTILRTSIAEALAAAGATATGADLLGERLGERVKFERVAGKSEIAVMQAGGKLPMGGSGPGGRATVGDLVKEAVEKWPSMFRPSAGLEKGNAPAAPVAQVDKVMARSEFETLSPTERAEKMKAGYRLVDANGNVPPAKKPAPVVRTIVRREFEALSPTDRMARMKSGFQLVD